MKVFKYWEKAAEQTQDQAGRVFDLVAWGHSNESGAVARRLAVENLAKCVEKLRSGLGLDRYDYARGEIREELVEFIRDSSDRVIAAVTRNGYGALVLNSKSIFIADVDAREPSALRRLFSFLGKPKNVKDARRALIADVAALHPKLAFAVYETHSGFRVFVVNDVFEPAGDASQALLTALGSDPLYVRLCKTQNCYRARLTPKPWRLGLSRPSRNFPRVSQEERAMFEAWIDRYRAASETYSVCRLETTLGKDRRSGEADRVLRVHDAAVLNQSGGALA